MVNSPYMPIEFQNWIGLLKTVFVSSTSGYTIGFILFAASISIFAFKVIIDYFF